MYGEHKCTHENNEDNNKKSQIISFRDNYVNCGPNFIYTSRSQIESECMLKFLPNDIISLSNKVGHDNDDGE